MTSGADRSRDGSPPSARSPQVSARDLDVVEEPAVVAEPVEPADGPLTVGELLDGAKGVGQAVAGAASGLAASAKRLVDQGRYRKVRISRKGKPILPDIPIAAAAAMEAASMYGGGIARVLAVNLGAKLLFDVEVVNEADKYVAKARAALLDGDVGRAREALVVARRMDDRNAGVEVELAVVARLEGDPATARKHLERAKALDPLGEAGKRAEALLSALDGGGRAP